VAVACLALVLILTACTRNDTWFEYTPTPPSDPAVEQALADAEAAYRAQVQLRLGDLEAVTAQFGEAFTGGDDSLARDLYLEARVLWEYVRPVAREFPDLLASIGARESDLGPLELWTGWHQAERALWPAEGDEPLSSETRAELAEALERDTRTLTERVAASEWEFTATQMAEGATEAVGNLSVNHALGLAELYSGADLWGIAGGVDGAFAAYAPLRDVIADSDPRLVETLDERFAAVQAQLDLQGSKQTGFSAHPELSTAEVRDLVRALDALAEPIALIAPAVAAERMGS
jgi:iron uptake system component EfeO